MQQKLCWSSEVARNFPKRKNGKKENMSQNNLKIWSRLLQFDSLHFVMRPGRQISRRKLKVKSPLILYQITKRFLPATATLFDLKMKSLNNCMYVAAGHLHISLTESKILLLEFNISKSEYKFFLLLPAFIFKIWIYFWLRREKLCSELLRNWKLCLFLETPLVCEFCTKFALARHATNVADLFSRVQSRDLLGRSKPAIIFSGFPNFGSFFVLWKCNKIKPVLFNVYNLMATFEMAILRILKRRCCALHAFLIEMCDEYSLICNWHLEFEGFWTLFSLSVFLGKLGILTTS